MSTKQFAQGLKETVEELRKEGITEINSENLIAYLDQVLGSSDDAISHTEMEKYRAQLQVWVEQHKGIQTSQIEKFKSVVKAGQHALRTSFLMNGGATVVILAFMGKLSE